MLKERHRKSVSFFQSNLREPEGRLGWAVYDVILCRNLLIYLGQEAFDALISLFGRSLGTRGYLLLGHSESLLGRGGEFLPTCVDGGVVYRKAR